MSDPITTGIGVGLGTSLLTGGDPLTGAAFGGLGGGAFGAFQPGGFASGMFGAALFICASEFYSYECLIRLGCIIPYLYVSICHNCNICRVCIIVSP